MRFPAKHLTDEPVVASALLLQLGQVEVTRVTQDHVPQIEEAQHVVTRVLAYRDELQHEWGTFTQQPVKYLIQATPCLRPAQEDRDNIPEVWDRQTLTLRMTRTSRQRLTCT